MIGDILKYLRKQHNLTQQEVAQALSIARSTYTSYENNTRSPDYDSLLKLADFFSVTTDFILGRTNLYQKTSPAKTPQDKELTETINHLLFVRELNEKDYEYIVKQVEDFANYVQKKNR